MTETALDFLKNRKTESGSVTRELNRVCSQGSSLGPVLLLLIMEDRFNGLGSIVKQGKQYEEDIVPTYADDQIILNRPEGSSDLR